MKISKRIIASELLTTDALVNSIRMLFILSIVKDTAFIASMKVVMLGSMFIFEIPSGYLGDTYGNKLIVIISKFAFILSMLMLLIGKSEIYFLLSFMFMGLFDALESGTKNSYYLGLFEESNDYKEVRVCVEKYRYAVTFIFSILSSILYYYNNKIPFIITIILAFISMLVFISLPKENKIVANQNKKNNLFINIKSISKDIVANKKFVSLLVTFTILTTLTIFVFDYYSIFFTDAGSPSYLIGMIYSTFALLGMIGVRVFQIIKKFKYILLLKLLLSCSFLLVLFNNLIVLLLMVIIQEIVFSYLNIEFEIAIISEVKERSDSSQYQSTIYVMYASMRILLTFILAFLMDIIGFNLIFILISIIGVVNILFQFVYNKKLIFLSK